MRKIRGITQANPSYNQRNKNKKERKVGIVICTLNCKEMLELCLASIKKQDTTGLDVNVYCADSDSTDGTLQVIEKYMAILIPHIPAGYMEGKGMAKSKAVDRALADGCEFIFTIDSDNAFVETDWLQKMIKPMEKDSTISFCICRMAVVPKDSAINRYCSYVGTDSFAIYKSLDPLITFGQIPLKDEGDYWTYEMKPNNLKIFGGYYVCYRRDTLISIGCYHRDVDNAYLMAQKGIAKLGIPNKCHIHHRQAVGFWNHLKKKLKWARYYFKEGYKNRKFDWNENKWEFRWNIIKCLLFFPALWTSLRMLVRYRDNCWLLHAPMTWLTTLTYLYAYFEPNLTIQDSA